VSAYCHENDLSPELKVENIVMQNVKSIEIEHLQAGLSFDYINVTNLTRSADIVDRV